MANYEPYYRPLVQFGMIQLAIVPRMDGDDAQFINAAFIGVLSRTPTSEETGACRQFLEEQAALLADPSRLTPATVGESSKLPPAKAPRARAKENLILVLFNHNDFISIR